MRNDWRTDNWGGYRDLNRDPNLYHFAKDLRGHGTLPYNRYYGGNEHNSFIEGEDFLSKKVSIFSIFMFVMFLLTLGGLSLWVRELLIGGGAFAQVWWDTIDSFIKALETR